MNAQNTEKKPVIKRETKNKIRVEFDRTPFKQRFKEKFLSLYFLQQLAVKIFWYILMIGISYIILEPFISQILSSIMAPEDFVDVTVNMIPRNVSFDIYKGLLTETFGGGTFFASFGRTFLISFLVAAIQMLVCCFIGYGFAKFKFRGRNLVFLLVMLTMIIPHQTLRHAMYLGFLEFDPLGIIRLLKGGGIEFEFLDIGALIQSWRGITDENGEAIKVFFTEWNVKDIAPWVANIFEKLNILPDHITIGHDATGEAYNILIKETGIQLVNTRVPMIILSLVGLGFKNGLYIFLLRQFFRGIPDELEESAYMDGCGTFHTFFRIILPLSVPMMVTVFLFAFCWQWTDVFYADLFNQTSLIKDSTLLVNLYDATKVHTSLPQSLQTTYAGTSLYDLAIRNTCSLLIIAPLIVLYAFCQNFLVQGIEHSGIAN